MQAKFILLYEGNGTEACRQAGYKGTDTALSVQAHENLSNPRIYAAIQSRNLLVSPMIATRIDRQLFLTNVMNDKCAELKDRIKATETLCKMDGDFIINHNINSDKPLVVEMNYSRNKKKKPIND